MNISAGQKRILEDLGLRLKIARGHYNDTQTQFGARIGIDKQTVAKMEKGNPAVRISTWIKASEILDCLDVWDDLFQPKEDPFETFDREQADKKKALKKRIRN